MGKSIPAAHRFEHFAKAITSTSTSTSTSLRRPTQSPSTAKIPRPISSSLPAGPGSESRHRLKLNNRGMEAADKSERQRRIPLAEVVTDCVNRWFQDTLKEAKTGDTAMQVLVGQMYYSGYGVARDAQKPFDVDNLSSHPTSDDFSNTSNPSCSDSLDSLYQSHSSMEQFPRWPGKLVLRDRHEDLGFELTEKQIDDRVMSMTARAPDCPGRKLMLVLREYPGRAWIGRAAKSRSSVWKVGDKHPGYNASDSDSDDPKEDAK